MNPCCRHGIHPEITQQNQAYRWRSKTPVRNYYGAEDEIVPSYIARLPIGYQQIMAGAASSPAEVQGAKANHHGAFVAAVAREKKWFDSFLAK